MHRLFVLPSEEPPIAETSDADTPSLSSSASSLNLIVRVSPLLRKQGMPPPSGQVSSSPSVPYDFYTSPEQTRGKSVVLFFVDAEDPFSLSHDALITTLSASAQLKIPTYRVDFSTAMGMKITYGVVVPDTFVFVDANGVRQQSLIHPRDDELKIFLTSSHP